MIPAWAELLLKAGVVGATLAVVVFIIQWSLTSPWWHDPVGRTVMAKDIGLLVLLIPNCISIFLRHALPLMAIIGLDIASLFIVAVSMAWRSVVWWRIKRPQSPRVLWRTYRHIRQAQADKDS